MDRRRLLLLLLFEVVRVVPVERLHRARANTEDRVRAAKQTGLDNLPFRDFDHNAVRLEHSLIAITRDGPERASSPD